MGEAIIILCFNLMNLLTSLCFVGAFTAAEGEVEDARLMAEAEGRKTVDLRAEIAHLRDDTAAEEGKTQQLLGVNGEKRRTLKVPL